MIVASIDSSEIQKVTDVTSFDSVSLVQNLKHSSGDNIDKVIGTNTAFRMSDKIKLTSTANLSVSDTSIIKLDADGGNITIDGLNGGRLGQILHLIKITSGNTVTIKHNNSSGEQTIGTVDDGDYVLSNKEGCTLVCIAASSDTVGNWRIVDK